MVDLTSRTTTAASVQPTPGGGFTLRLPRVDSRHYALAQLDDYVDLPRSRFRWNPPLALRLRAKLTAQNYAGTWGFGLWNDPFTASLGIAGTGRRLPVLPNCAWFFFGSPENHLALADGQPGNGMLAAILTSPHIPSALLAPGLLGAPLMAWRRSSRGLRRLAARFARGEAARLEVDTTQWLEYRLRWSLAGVTFAIANQQVFEAGVSPRGPLGLVIWLDNQFAAWRPDGSLAAGRLANDPATLEIEGLEVERK